MTGAQSLRLSRVPAAAQAQPSSEAQRLSLHLAQLTEFRQRVELDTSLTQAIFGLFQAEEVAVLRPSGESVNRRWWTRARVSRADGRWLAEGREEGRGTVLSREEIDGLERALQGEILRFSTHPGAVALLPLHSGNQASGVLEVRTSVPLSDEVMVLVQDILRVYRNVQGLLDYSERDMLTGLLNRKTFDQMYFELSGAAVADGKVESEAVRRKGVLWAGVIDVDHFKAVNDRFGHMIGDEVLLLLSGLMKRSFREEDALFRFGGEEFVVLLRARTESDARDAFERFRAAVEATAFPQVGTLTVSIGFAGVQPGESPTEVLGRADLAVYHAKHHGRNQVHGYATLVESKAIHVLQNEGDIELF